MNTQNRTYLKTIAKAAEKKSQGVYGIYADIARLAVNGGQAREDSFRASADFVLQKADCFDFVLPGFIYILTRFGNSEDLPGRLADEAKKLIIDAKYWIDEGGFEKSPCYFTENHQMLFHSCEYAAGRLYPNEKFSNNGMTGREHEAHAAPMLERWLEWRFRFGFCEWLSNTYYHEDMLSLALVMACGDGRIKRRAAMIADQLFYDMAVNTFRGVFGSTHGRAYCSNLCAPTDSCAVLRRLFLGDGDCEYTMSAAAVLLASENYSAAQVLKKIAVDREPLEHRRRMSLKPEQGAALGVDPADPENVTFYWGMQAFSHRLVVDNTLAVKHNEGYYLMERARAYKENFLLCDAANTQTQPDCDYTSMPQADIYTYKTSDYMLSVAQDYKKGRFGFQQHIWQACLGGQAVVFTNHPASPEYNGRPNRWAGNRIMPKAVAYKNVLMCLYNTDVSLVPDFVHYTHAYFPQEFMDEYICKNGWHFGRKGDSYVGLYTVNKNAVFADPDSSFLPTMGFAAEAKIKPYELNSNGRSNVWVCQLGSRSECGDFADFVDKVSASDIEGDVFEVRYASAYCGEIKTGWNLPLTVNDESIPLCDYSRYDDKYCNAPAGTTQMKFSFDGSSVELDFSGCVRKEK